MFACRRGEPLTDPRVHLYRHVAVSAIECGASGVLYHVHLTFPADIDRSRTSRLLALQATVTTARPA